MRKWGLLFGAASLFAFAGCSNGASDKTETGSGSLSLALTGADSQGVVYRLRDATFGINGYPDYPIYPGTGGTAGGYYSEVVSTEEDPDRTSIDRRVLAGYYYISLQNTDWYLERVTSSGAERVEKAALLSPADVNVWVYPNSNSNVHYRFGVDGDLIDFRGGDLSVRIDIELPGEGPYSRGGAPNTGGQVGFGGALPVAGSAPGGVGGAGN